MLKSLLLISLFGNCIIACSQSTNRIKLVESTIVRDSTGKVCTYETWTKLLTTGYYDLKPLKPGDPETEFVLKRLTEEERKKKLARSPKPAETKIFKTGELIDNFKAEDIHGNKINLEDLRGKIVVLNFWFINCWPCRMEIPELNKIVADFKDSTGIIFLAISTDSKGALQKFQEKNSFDYTIIPDGRSVASTYDIEGYPTNVIVDKEGKVRFHASGYGMATAFWIRKTIEELLKPTQ